MKPTPESKRFLPQSHEAAEFLKMLFFVAPCLRVSKPAGITIDDFDLQIGCTALMLNYTVVSNNTKHFDKIPGLILANWAG